jgi:sirohydrochlorin ferrochelatase/(2Fe-2S) ferredoxin
MTREVLLIVGHGSRDASANLEFEALVQAVRDRHPERRVSLGYVELAEPCVSLALAHAASDADSVVVLPLFLFAAGHVKNDIPLALAQARKDYPQVRFRASRVLGVHPRMAELAFQRAASACDLEPARTAVVLVGRGASDPDANGDFCKLARLFGEGRGLHSVTPCFMGITRPAVPETLEQVARSRPERLLVVPYLLFGGRLIAKLGEMVHDFSARYPWIRTAVAQHLGADPALLDLLEERTQQALTSEAPLPCDNCQYRAPVAGVTENVGGLRALLYSLRHTVTHSQAMPHAHAHKALKRHVLVCGNVDCADSGSIALLGELRRLVKAEELQAVVRVTRTSCMGRCGEGPTVAVYPDGIWYRGVREADAEELVREHLKGDRLVARLVDNIMQ